MYIYIYMYMYYIHNHIHRCAMIVMECFAHPSGGNRIPKSGYPPGMAACELTTARPGACNSCWKAIMRRLEIVLGDDQWI